MFLISLSLVSGKWCGSLPRKHLFQINSLNQTTLPVSIARGNSGCAQAVQIHTEAHLPPTGAGHRQLGLALPCCPPVLQCRCPHCVLALLLLQKCGLHLKLLCQLLQACVQVLEPHLQGLQPAFYSREWETSICLELGPQHTVLSACGHTFH